MQCLLGADAVEKLDRDLARTESYYQFEGVVSFRCPIDCVAARSTYPHGGNSLDKRDITANVV